MESTSFLDNPSKTIPIRQEEHRRDNNPIVPDSKALHDNLKYILHDSEDKSARYCQYNLCGIIMHQGVIEGGHYWCTVKESGKWYEIDDEKVRDLNGE